MRVVNGFYEQTECALKLLDNSLGERGELDGWIFIVDVFSQLGNSFSIGLSFELEALAREESPQLFVVCCNAIVNNNKL